MAKRTIQECDLTKREYDPEETVKITIKAAGKRQGRTYELSSHAAQILERQLVSGKPLADDWDFVVSRKPTRRSEIIDVDEDDNDSLASRIKSEQRDRIGNDEEETDVFVELFSEFVPGDDPDCIHMNKGRVTTTLRDKKKFVYQKCTGCGAEIPVKSSRDNNDYMSAVLPENTREGRKI